VVSALDYRERTGEGQYIDISQYEATVQFLGPAILDYTVNGRVWNRAGNQLIDSELPYAAPHGAYPTRGDERWCAIAVFDDEQWRRLVDLMGDPDWARDARFSTHDARRRHTEELDQRMGQWTAGFEARQLMEMLQERGITAGVVHDQQGLYEDVQLNARQHFRRLEHPELGQYHVELPAAHLSETPARMRKASPTIGGDNDYVYKTILGLSQGEYDLLIAEEVIGYWEGD
ncbi:MAG: CoA transferase, partial [Dehalococcoidia bacterium]